MQLVVLFGWTISNIELTNLRLLSYIQIFCHPSTEYHTTLRSPYSRLQRKIRLLQKRTAIQKTMNSLTQITEAQLGRGKSYHPNQKRFKDLIRYFTFKKSNALLLTFKPKDWTLLDQSVPVADYKRRDQCF